MEMNDYYFPSKLEDKNDIVLTQYEINQFNIQDWEISHLHRKEPPTAESSLYFHCVACGQHRDVVTDKRRYHPKQALLAKLRAFEGKGILCSTCDNFDTDVCKRDDSPRQRADIALTNGLILRSTDVYDCLDVVNAWRVTHGRKPIEYPKPKGQDLTKFF